MARLAPVCLLACLLFASCSESTDEVVEYADWQNKNQTYWDKLYATTQQKIAAGDRSWKIIKNWSLEDSLRTENTTYIIAHVVTEGSGTATPLYNDTVRVHYKGSLLPSATHAEGYVFDTSWGTATSPATAAPAQGVVSGFTDGFATALQGMHVGDEWEVYIPWTLAYGTAGTAAIPGYSVLKFDVQLVSFHHRGTTDPSFKAKAHAGFGAE